jgi:hypothetical protein
LQRFGSSLDLNVHFHVMVLDGVFTRDDQGHVVFHHVPAPTGRELDDVVRRVHRRVGAWLERKGLARAAPIEDRSQDTPGQTSLDACATVAMGRGTVRMMREDPDVEGGSGDGASAEQAPSDEGAAEYEGFNLHASVTIAADDDLGRERLMRYGARPPFALERLRRLPGGRLAYRIKKVRGGRAKHRVMTPLELLARLAALVPPPRYPLLRYHGVLAPRSAWRCDVVPRVPKAATGCEARPASDARKPDDPPARRSGEGARAGVTRTRAPGAVTPAAGSPPAPGVRIAPETSTDASRVNAAVLAPNVLSVKHWGRLLGGLLYAASPRVDWATLLRRSFEVDVLCCPSCGGRMRVLGEITGSRMVTLVLESLELPTEAPRAARARDPTELLGLDGFAP